MAITAPIAGAYTGSYGGTALGYTRQGYNLNFTQRYERLEETDLYGLTLIDMVYRGAQMTIDTICKLYNGNTFAGSQAGWPWQGTLGNIWTAAAPIARLASAVAAALVLTAVANTPAANSPATLTASKTILSDQGMQLNFNSTIREVPLRFDVLATDSAGTGSLFAVT